MFEVSDASAHDAERFGVADGAVDSLLRAGILVAQTVERKKLEAIAGIGGEGLERMVGVSC